MDAGGLVHCLVAFPRPSPGWEGKLWPLPACQVEMETLELEVLVPPHPPFAKHPCARHSVGAMDLGKIACGCSCHNLLW